MSISLQFGIAVAGVLGSVSVSLLVCSIYIYVKERRKKPQKSNPEYTPVQIEEAQKTARRRLDPAYTPPVDISDADEETSEHELHSWLN